MDERDPAEAALDNAMAEGILDAAAVAGVRTAAQTARIPREPAAEPGSSALSDALAELREDER